MGHVFNEIVEMIGPAAAKKIAEEWGGTFLYFPKPDSLEEDHRLVKLVGWDAAKIICQAFSQNVVELPLACCTASFKRREQIENLLREGLSIGKVARACGVTSRTIRRHNKRMRQERNRRLQLLGQTGNSSPSAFMPKREE